MKFEYKIIKTHNKKRKQCIYRSRNFDKAKDRFLKFWNDSKKVIIPKLYANSDKLYEIRNEILFITDDPQYKRLDYFKKKISSGKKEWYIIDIRNYKEEAKFYYYPDKQFINYVDIYNFLKEKPQYYSIYLFFNKLIIDSSLRIERLVVCKNIAEVTMLYNKLKNSKLKLTFLGRLSRQNRSILKNKIIRDMKINPIKLMSKKSKY